ncbi:MAG: protoporphyrinogen oxidase [Acidobacteriaceae bacterium]
MSSRNRVAKRIAIIGGGISGLSAAYQLARDSQSQFTLFEASPRLGGIVETIHKDGFVIECGPDSWVTEKPWARELAVELGLESEIISSNDTGRRTWLFQHNQLIPMPDGMRMMVPTQLSAIDDSPLFTPEARLAFHREPDRAEELKASALPSDKDESVASFVRRHFGEEAARTVAAPLLSGVLGGNIETLSARAVLPAFVQMEREHGSLISALASRPTQAENSIFTTLRTGLGTLIDRMAAALPPKSIRLSQPVLNIARAEQRWRLSLKRDEEIYDAVILATPAHITRALLRSIDPQFVPLLTIESTSAIVVALAFTPQQARSLKIPGGFGYLVPQNAAPENPQLLACTFVHQKFPDRVPQGGALLRAFFGSETAANLLNEPDEILADLALEQLKEALGRLSTPHLTVVRRWPLSLPQYAVGHLDRVAQLESLTAQHPGLRLIGNAYHGVGLPDMVRMGRHAAQSLQSQ